MTAGGIRYFSEDVNDPEINHCFLPFGRLRVGLIRDSPECCPGSGWSQPWLPGKAGRTGPVSATRTST